MGCGAIFSEDDYATRNADAGGGAYAGGGGGDFQNRAPVCGQAAGNDAQGRLAFVIDELALFILLPFAHMGHTGCNVVLFKMPFLDADGAFAANLFPTAQRFYIYTKQPRRFNQANALRDGTSSSGRLKIYHHFVICHRNLLFPRMPSVLF